MLRSDDFLKGQVLIEAWRQTLEYGGYLPTVAVLGCLGNRYRLGWGSYGEILERIPNFSAVLEQPNRNKYPNIWAPEFTRLLHEVEGQFDGSTKDLSSGALYWGDSRHIEREWFIEHILKPRDDNNLPVHPIVANINSLTFWR